LPEVRPFPGILYRGLTDGVARVLAPPYDVISPAGQRELEARDPHNIVRVILTRTPGEEGYAEAGATFRRWIDEGVLAKDAEPAFYVLEQTFEALGQSRKRWGLVALFRSEDPEKGVILPHEQTRKAPREDRYRLLKATRANFSPIFLMFPDPDGRFPAAVAAAVKAPPVLTYTDDGGVAHRLWRVTDAASASALQQALAGARAYIADGHHRHATALRYRDETGPDGAWTMGYFTPLESPGLVVLPYHRILRQGPSLDEARRALQGRFRLTDAADAAAAARGAARSQARYAFGLAEPGMGALVAEGLPAGEALLPADAPPSLRALDTYFLHRVVLPLLRVPDDAVDYVHSQAEAEEAVAGAACRLAILMRPTPVAQIVAVADAGESMPAKSTYFHPKIPSGLVIHPLVV
jgi:uncharacterized protein (DUF1015 family)